MYDDAKGMEEIYESLENVYNWTSEWGSNWGRLKYVKWTFRSLMTNE